MNNYFFKYSIISDPNKGQFCVTGSPPLRTVAVDYILHVLRMQNGNKNGAAKALGISRRTVYTKAKEERK